MELKELIRKVDNLDAEKEAVSSFFQKCVKDAELCDIDVSNIAEDEIKQCVMLVDESRQTALGDKLSLLKAVAKEKVYNAEEFCATDYIKQAKKILRIIEKVIGIYTSAMKEVAELAKGSRESRQVDEGDVSRLLIDVSSLKGDVNRLSGSIDNLEDKTKDFDSKVFQVLLNTIAILGIFVAIAFAGFGTVTIFTDIDIATWMQSKETFVKNTFVLLLTSLLSYNLLLLLVCFIYKLSILIPIYNNALKNDKNKDNLKENSLSSNFIRDMKLTPFVIIDLVMLVLVIGLFVWGVFFF